MLNSPIDLAIVFGIALLVFGPKKLPELGKSLGQGIGNFKKSLHEAQEDVKGGLKSDQDKQPAPPVAKKEEASEEEAATTVSATGADDNPANR